MTPLLDRLASTVGAGYVSADPEVLAGRAIDHTGRYRGQAQALVRPASTSGSALTYPAPTVEASRSSSGVIPEY